MLSGAIDLFQGGLYEEGRHSAKRDAERYYCSNAKTGYREIRFPAWGKMWLPQRAGWSGGSISFL